MFRYERGETEPNSEAITELAHALDTTVDFLMSGASDDVVQNLGLDKEITSRFKQNQNLRQENKKNHREWVKYLKQWMIVIFKFHRY